MFTFEQAQSNRTPVLPDQRGFVYTLGSHNRSDSYWTLLVLIEVPIFMSGGFFRLAASGRDPAFYLRRDVDG